MRVAVCVSGACRLKEGKGSFRRVNERLKSKFPGADFYYATWSGYTGAFEASFPHDQCVYFKEPNVHYHPYVDIRPEAYTSSHYQQRVDWVKKGGEKRIEWTSHHAKQILIHTWLSDRIRADYDIVVRTRFDALISKNADFAPYLQDTFENHRANGFATTRPHGFNDLFEADPRPGMTHHDWMFDHVIIHNADAIDRAAVDLLYEQKLLHAAEAGWCQIISMPHGFRHRNHSGWVNPIGQILDIFLVGDS